jgi:excisionase family DNA binding protein
MCVREGSGSLESTLESLRETLMSVCQGDGGNETKMKDSGFTKSGNSPTFEPLLKVEEAAKLLGGMHPKSLMRLARNNEVPAIKLGKFWYFRASTLSNWVEQHQQGTGAYA